MAVRGVAHTISAHLHTHEALEHARWLAIGRAETGASLSFRRASVSRAYAAKRLVRLFLLRWITQPCVETRSSAWDGCLVIIGLTLTSIPLLCQVDPSHAYCPSYLHTVTMRKRLAGERAPGDGEQEVCDAARINGPARNAGWWASETGDRSATTTASSPRVSRGPEPPASHWRAASYARDTQHPNRRDPLANLGPTNQWPLARHRRSARA